MKYYRSNWFKPRIMIQITPMTWTVSSRITGAAWFNWIGPFGFHVMSTSEYSEDGIKWFQLKR